MTRRGARALRLIAGLLVCLAPACTATRGPRATAGSIPAAATAPDAAVAGRVEARFAAAESEALWSVRIERADTRAVVVDRQSDRLVIPASNMKIVTLAAAATRLGWDYRFQTTIGSRGGREAHVLRGDLLVVGGADPTIGSGTDPLATFREWAQTLRASGLRRIDGDLIGDPSRFGVDWLGDTWSWGDLPFGYGAAYSGLTYHENMARLTVTPADSPDSEALVSLDPEGTGLVVSARVVTSASVPTAALQVRRDPGSAVLSVEGTVPIGGAALTRTVAVPDPAMFFLTAFRTALAEAGVEVRGRTRVEPTADPGDTVLLTHWSEPLAQVAHRFMKVSQNLYGEALLRVLAPERATSMADARRITASTLETLGVTAGQVQGIDGSGLSRRDFLTSRALVTLLQAMAQPPHREVFRATLPVAGVDGTLASRFKDGPCAGRLAAKTGTLSNVRALSGYLTSATGTPYVFSVIANNYLGAAARIDEVVDEALNALCAS